MREVADLIGIAQFTETSRATPAYCAYHACSDAMTSDPDKIDELVDDLDDLKTTVEEIEENPPRPVDRKTMRKLKDALDEASGIADELEDEDDRSAS